MLLNRFNWEEVLTRATGNVLDYRKWQIHTLHTVLCQKLHIAIKKTSSYITLATHLS